MHHTPDKKTLHAELISLKIPDKDFHLKIYIITGTQFQLTLRHNISER